MTEKEIKLQPSYYTFIPAEVRYHEELKPSAKILYGDIADLANAHGYCSVENRYFAELFNISKYTVSVLISNLEKYGFIKTEIEYIEGTKQISRRLIYILDKDKR